MFEYLDEVEECPSPRPYPEPEPWPPPNSLNHEAGPDELASSWSIGLKSLESSCFSLEEKRTYHPSATMSFRYLMSRHEQK